MRRFTYYLLLASIFFFSHTVSAQKELFLNDVFSLQGFGLQSVPINKTISVKGELTGNQITLDNRSAIFGAGITAEVKFLNDASLARVILLDAYGNEYLVYEVYSLLADDKAFSVKNACQETKLLNSVTPKALQIELLDASITIQRLDVVSSLPFTREEVTSLQKQIQVEQEQQKIDLLNLQIKKKGMSWTAGHTSLSSLTYTQKKMMFEKNGMLANLQGFEYYTYGVFDLKSNLPETAPTVSTAIDSFDWRNRHGANNLKSPYYDGDSLGGGWATSIKDQASPQYCGSCWAHSTCANAEMLANLYYNKHIDMNLAEQELMECSDACTSGKGCSGGWPNKASKWVSTHGIMEEECFPYKASDAPTCADTCTTPKENLHFASTISTSGGKISEDSLKKFIIIYGPVNVAISSMSHAMCLVGYHKVSGKTSWIFKNSHGIKTGVKGYTEVKPTSLSDFSSVDAYKLPVISKLYTDKDIRCVDLDKDGYYNWGIGPKPSTCPECQAEEDCDDSRNDLGPMQPDGSCKPITVHITSSSMMNPEIAYQCRPNPFNRVTTITFQVPTSTNATVRIYTVAGNLVKTLFRGNAQEGLLKVLWNGTNEKGEFISNGTYICKIQVDNTYKSKSSYSFKIFMSR